MFFPSNPHHDYILELSFGKSCLASYKKAKDAVFLFLHHLHVRRFLQKDKDAYIPISSIEMSAACGKRPWENARSILIKAGIIEVNHRYEIGVKCKSYRLTYEWRNDVKWREVKKPVKLVKQQFSYPIDKPVDGWSMDKQQAKAAIKERYKHDPEQLRVFHHIIDNLEDYNYCTKGKTGRIYSIWNGLPKQTRQAIIKEGKSTVELDVKNSQPLILASLCKDAEYKKAVESGKFYDHCAEDFQLRRSDFKHKFLKWIGGAKDKQLDGYMRDKFPVMANFVINEKHKDYKGLICKLQEIEAKIITSVPNSLSIHDGVCVAQEDAKLAKEHIEQGFSQLGLKPIIEPENLLLI